MWNGPLATFTHLMLDKVLHETCRRLELTDMQEYWNTDAIFYTQKDDKFGPKAAYAEYIAVAVEVENDFKASHQEINHLSTLNTPLKVLITYPT